MTLFEARKKQGLSQTELALKADLTQATVSKIEAGKVLSYKSTRVVIERILKCKINWIQTRLGGRLTWFWIY